MVNVFGSVVQLLRCLVRWCNGQRVWLGGVMVNVFASMVQLLTCLVR
jgi:hypothetical protein